MPDRLRAVGHILDAEFLFDAATLDFLGMKSVEGRCQDLVVGRPGKEIAGKLLRDEL